ncbi:MAG: hypothetical protein DHS20C08_04490 [Rhodomicrobium sp.]|nr:MAG: hypothetical protein DHS20C08_04490 [Rhodomicrobium sp.]
MKKYTFDYAVDGKWSTIEVTACSRADAEKLLKPINETTKISYRGQLSY